MSDVQFDNPTLVIDPPAGGFPVSPGWREDILVAAGATAISVLRAADGAVTEILTEPQITAEAYEAAATAVLKASLTAYAARLRWKKEAGGIIVEGQAIATDRESQALISGAYSLVQAQPETIIQFKTRAGFVSLDAAQMSAIAVAVAKHVQACFGIEADAVAEIQSGSITTPAEIDAAFV